MNAVSTVYAALTIAGLVVSEWLIPADIRQHWTWVSRALLLATALLGCLHASLERWTAAAPAEDRGAVRRGMRLFLVCAAAFLAATVLVRFQGDYGTFRMIWAVVLRGDDPWWGRPLNAYGPAFNALALLTPLTPLAPKLLFAFAYLMLVAWLAAVVAPRRYPSGPIWPVAILAVMNPLAWIEQVHWGNFDVLVAVACVAAVDARVKGRDVASGAWLGFGIALKFFPAVLVPVLAFDRGRLRMKLLAACVGVLAVGFGTSLLLWGSATARPLIFAGSRPSTNSLFSFVRGPISPLRLVWETPNVDWLSTPLLLAAILAVSLWSVRTRVEPARAGLATVLAGLLFYRTGLTRYQVIVAAVVAYWALTEQGLRTPRRMLTLWLVCYLAWLTFCDAAGWLDAVMAVGSTQPYAVVSGMRLVAGRAWGPVIFLLECSLLAGLMLARRENAQSFD